jgi:predicted DNA-binding transcriptional regulator AlpA
MEDAMRLIDARGLREEKGITYSKTHRDRLIKEGKFPKPMSFGPGGKNHWREDEIDALIATKLAQRDEVA